MVGSAGRITLALEPSSFNARAAARRYGATSSIVAIGLANVMLVMPTVRSAEYSTGNAKPIAFEPAMEPNMIAAGISEASGVRA